MDDTLQELTAPELAPVAGGTMLAFDFNQDLALRELLRLLEAGLPLDYREFAG
jgi:hypothetical protein